MSEESISDTGTSCPECNHEKGNHLRFGCMIVDCKCFSPFGEITQNKPVPVQTVPFVPGDVVRIKLNHACDGDITTTIEGTEEQARAHDRIYHNQLGVV